MSNREPRLWRTYTFAILAGALGAALTWFIGVRVLGLSELSAWWLPLSFGQLIPMVLGLCLGAHLDNRAQARWQGFQPPAFRQSYYPYAQEDEPLSRPASEDDK